jgi:hypothetical protein
MGYIGRVAHVEDTRNAYTILVSKSKGKRQLLKARCRWTGIIKMNIKQTRWDGDDWIYQAQDRK